MTPLRFRAFDKEHGIMMSHDDIDRSDKEGIVMWGELFNGNEKDIVVMQSTGLKDSHGVEIFEGDVLRKDLHGSLFMDQYVAWDFVIGGYTLLPVVSYWHQSLRDEVMRRMKVIGNIYENPDLLPKAS